MSTLPSPILPIRPTAAVVEVWPKHRHTPASRRELRRLARALARRDFRRRYDHVDHWISTRATTIPAIIGVTAAALIMVTVAGVSIMNAAAWV